MKKEKKDKKIDSVNKISGAEDKMVASLQYFTLWGDKKV